MRPIRLPEPPIGRRSAAEVFEAGIYGIIKRVVVIGNGFSGAENQCIGLVRALGLSGCHTLYRVTRPRGGINKWLHWLPVSLHKKLDYVMRQICIYSGVQVEAGWSKVVPFTIEKTGRALCWSSRLVGIQFLLRAPLNDLGDFTIQHPRSRLNRFDLVITPQHDYHPLTPHGQRQIPWFLRRWITPRRPPDGHVVLTVGALHLADSAALRSAASVWHDELAPLARPLLVVNIGGPTSSCQYGADLAKRLIAMLQNVLWSCGSVRISFSRRTPEKVSKILLKEFSSNPKVYIWDGEGPNPHMGHLAWADAFVITADSVSMLSEASTTGKPVYVIGAERCTWKFADFQKSLRDRGAVRPFTGKEDISESWSYPPLNDTAEAASQVMKALADRGWTIDT
ncbi:hypothetical protein CXB51_003305 [Gossypium anomalum]|uniref:Mitochondrial fission protein ELM1 n=1 Tax=Gossypium anomalum TaxID=47600 RepID=A0A8J6DBJ8_9ROSI|nr:hypothetical protein CXB51_003305 [Gossypium anomalum]